ncbi:MAG: type II secretion system minor pseudopilin GspH [Hydrocarboniphaga effusa]|nr:type II secretion system minor pseudopilin GspH [Hydrocarboniphaga effusa]
MSTRPSALAPHGFTLFELLIVIVIIGIMASFAVLSLGSRALDERLDTEARRLNELIALAAEEAVLQGTELGFIQTADGYAFLVLKEGKWLPLEDNGALRPRALNEPFYLELRMEDRPVAAAKLDDEKVELKPQVLLLSSGEATAFRLDLHARNFAVYFQLEGDVLGRLKLERKEPES